MNGDGDKGKYTSPHGSKTWEYLAIFVCTVLTLCVGILFGWNSPTVVLLLKPNSPVPVTISDISTLTVSLMLAQMLAPFINMFAIDKIGRKYALLFCGLPIVATWCLIIVAKSVSVLYVARFFSGISVGLVFIITPMYLGEISSIKTRGVNGTLLGITSNLGILLSYIIVPYLTITTTASIFLIPSICFVILLPFIPESPYYLAMKGKIEEAENVLEKLRGKIDVSEELNMILESLKKKDENKGGNMGTLKEMFMIKGNRRAFLIILLFVTCNHFSGYITMIIYGQLIFKETSSRISHYTENIIVGIILLLSSILIIFFVDKLGRKPLIFVSGIIIGFCNLTIGSFFYVKDYINENISTYFLIPLIAFIILIFFSNSMFNLMLIMVSEIFSIEVKAFSSCVIGIAGGLFGTIVSKLYIFISISLNYGHSVPFYGFCIIIWITIFILFNLVPETKGKTFQDIQRELNK
ncbi:facilitated trehalose transporter Tret1-like isoform X1 [Vespa mandarinia]|uniref:facilitated trehalose transporter Tret1-like isoform X1 n=1 Tax=Vespa mandarinia TaxID=7446 RepID=UPI00160D1AC0|nr:facilitated trehalose transporter Tret1-like isoform X1 [Vespa mandarinia]